MKRLTFAEKIRYVFSLWQPMDDVYHWEVHDGGDLDHVALLVKFAKEKQPSTIIIGKRYYTDMGFGVITHKPEEQPGMKTVIVRLEEQSYARLIQKMYEYRKRRFKKFARGDDLFNGWVNGEPLP